MKDISRIERAIAMRQEGQSVGGIAKVIGASKGSVSLWVRHVQLTPSQSAVLEKNRSSHQKIATLGLVRKSSRARAISRCCGRSEAKKRDWLHAAGCMLYWGEGTKNRNVAIVANSELPLLKLFVRFLTESMGVDKKQIVLRVEYYTGNGKTEEEVAAWWLNGLGLSRSALKSIRSDYDKKWRNGKKIGKIPYGTCRVEVCNTDLVQRISGAISEYAGIDDMEWRR